MMYETFSQSERPDPAASGGSDTPPEADLLAVNARFNAELSRQIAGTLPPGHVYRLGRPGGILLSAGIPDLPIEMASARLLHKSNQENHPFNISDVYDLVLYLNAPLAVFRYGNNAKNVIVEIEHDRRQYLIGIHFRRNYRGSEISDVRGIFPKDTVKWLNWIAQGKADYLHKEKIQTLIDKQRTNSAEVAYLDLDLITKIVQTEDNGKPNRRFEI